MDHSLVMARGLCNSMKIRIMLCRATKDGWVTVKSSDKTWSTEGGNGKQLQYSCPKNPMNNMKRQKKYITQRNKPTRLGGIQYSTEGEWRAITKISKRMESLGHSRNDPQL